jgi:hypothetical protein
MVNEGLSLETNPEGTDQYRNVTSSGANRDRDTFKTIATTMRRCSAVLMQDQGSAGGERAIQAASLPVDAPEDFDLDGAAATPRITTYLPNRGEVAPNRSLDELVDWAEIGVIVPDYVRLIVMPPEMPPMVQGRRVAAKYIEFRIVRPAEPVFWSHARLPSIVDPRLNAVIVNLDSSVLQKDEEFLHILAHEMDEVVQLKAVFDNCGGVMAASRLHELVQPSRLVRNLHWNAWEFADSVLEKWRGVR